MADKKSPDSPKRKRSRREDVKLLERIRTKKPNLYKVLIMNDDYTTQEFVIYILARFFPKTSDEDLKIMMEAHTKGMAVVGVYTRDIAETRVMRVEKFSQEHGHPLMLTVEPE